MGETAAEFMAKLQKNKKYLAMKKANDEKFAVLERMYTEDEKILLEDLRSIGFSVNSVWDFVNSNNYYVKAAPVLIKHLTLKHHPKTLAGIARALAMPELSSDDDLWSFLVVFYDKTLSDSEIKEPVNRGLQQAISLALRSLATVPRLENLEMLIKRNNTGDGIYFLQEKLKELYIEQELK